MKYGQLGETQQHVSVLCMGSNFPDESRVALQLVQRALDCGINYFDITHEFEPIMGTALHLARPHIALATRLSIQQQHQSIRSRHIIHAVEQSLLRLKTDYIDIFQMAFDTTAPFPEVLHALDKLTQIGKIRYIGDSGMHNWKIIHALNVVHVLGKTRAVSVHPNYSLVVRSPEANYLPMAQDFKLAITPISPLHDGFLSDYIDHIPPESDVIEGLQAEAWDLRDMLREMANRKQATLSQLALAWTLQQKGITSLMIYPRSLAELDDYLGAIHLHLTENDLARINLFAPPRGNLWHANTISLQYAL